MKKNILFFTLLFTIQLLGQTKTESLELLSRSNLKLSDSLKNSYSKNDSIRNLRIVNYIGLNPSAKISFKSKNGSFYDIYDIINNKPIYYSNNNLSAAKVTKINTLHNGGSLGLNLEGQNMIVGVWDGGFALKNHVEFFDDNISLPESRVTIPQSTLPLPISDDHATHVLGTIISKGVNENAKGMAPKASAYSYNWTNDITNVTTLIQNTGLLVSNHSYGVPVVDDENVTIDSWIMGCYSSQARDWDSLHNVFPYYLMVTSAGNSGADTYAGGLAAGFDKLTMNKNAKNNLVVANANPTILPSGFVTAPINGSSSQGPTDDGRIKPDMAGDGTNLFSTFNDTDSSYITYSGTSMASPNVAGGALLLQQYYNQLNGSFMRSSTLKSVITHTAKDSGSTGPDPIFGWGLLDANKAAQLIANDANNTGAIILENSLANSNTYTANVVLSSARKLEVTLCWNDPAGIPRDNILNDSSPVLVNDLDLRITNSSNTYFPWKLNLSNISAPATTGDNIVDNIEKVEINNAIGNYTIQISHKGSLSGSNQQYSLIISGYDQVILDNLDFSKNNFSVYPNPTNSVISVDFDDNIITSYVLYDIQGREVLSENKLFNDSFDIDLSSFNSGIYLLKIATDKGDFTQKVIKN